MKIARMFLLILLILAIGSHEAHAFGSYATNFSSRYPSSQTLTNVTSGAGNSCQLCHQSSGGGDGWNGYGWAMKTALGSASTTDAALQQIESLNSDGDAGGSSNLAEINANTQPGWKSGAANTIYFANGSTQANQSPPAGILGSMDPVAATPTATKTSTPGVTNTPMPSATKTSTPIVTNTPMPSATKTSTPVVTNTPMPSATKTPTPVFTNTPIPSVTGTPGHGVCRDARFWGRHAGTEKAKSENIVQAALDAVGGAIQICGQNIDTTVMPANNSAVEALCVRSKGDPSLHLVRELTAASLNCIMTNGQADCKGTRAQALFTSCNTACPGGDPSFIDQCVASLACSNRGGVYDAATGACQSGTCSDGGAECVGGNKTSHSPSDSDSSDDDEESCQERPLVNGALGLDFEGSESAGSAKACYRAKRNDCSVLGPSNANCP